MFFKTTFQKLATAIFIILVVLAIALFAIFTTKQLSNKRIAMPQNESVKVSSPSVSLRDQCAKTPDFDDYPAEDIYEGKIAQVDFSTNPSAEPFRAVITTAAAKGTNFAGKYTVVEWGCGTSCQNHAIIDAASGRIVELGLLSFYGILYDKDSKLLVLNPPDNITNDTEEELAVEYYIMENGRLGLSCRLPVESISVL